MLLSQSGIISSTDWYTIHKLYMCLHLHRQRLQYLNNVCQLLKKCFDIIQSLTMTIYALCVHEAYPVHMRTLSRYIATLSMTKQTCHMSKHCYSTHNVRQGED